YGNKSGKDVDTLSTIFLHTILSNNNDIDLIWNPISIPIPLGSNNWYMIYRKFSNSGWILVDSTQNSYYSDNTIAINDTVYYKVEIENNSGCKSVSSVSSMPYISDDAGVIDIMEPDSTGTLQNIKVVVKNFGYKTIDTLPISYEIPLHSSATEIWYGQLASGDTLIYDFLFNPVFPSQPFEICASTQLMNDALSNNDTLCKLINPFTGIAGNEFKNFTLLYLNPDPENGIIKLSYYLPKADCIHLCLYRCNGQLMREYSYKGLQGSNEFKVPVPSLSSGLYLIQAQSGNYVLSSKFIITKF
ncbi:T9SS type A sorting domain-containing protein, partial [Bacteroidota bacterium]